MPSERVVSKNTFAVIVAGSVLVLDQLTKWAVREAIPLGSAVPVIDGFFNLVHVRNSGGAFSLFAGTDAALRVPFFLIASAIAITVLVYFLRQVEPQQRVLTFALSGVLGGALGNLVDRIIAGKVTDFLDVYLGSYHWPAFNVADSFISIGVVIMLAHSLFFDEGAPSTKPESSGR